MSQVECGIWDVDGGMSKPECEMSNAEPEPMNQENDWPAPPRTESCVLCSGGLDSVVLLAWAAREAFAQPVYVRTGLAWESQELASLQPLIASMARVRP